VVGVWHLQEQHCWMWVNIAEGSEVEMINKASDLTYRSIYFQAKEDEYRPAI
jgi:hypothetical protein